MMNSPRRGRRIGKPDTRAEILTVARRRFLSDGYPSVTLRAVAAEAGVDVALISYHFGSKRGLFGAALELVVNPADVLRTALDGDLALFAGRALRAMIATWDDPTTGRPLQAMYRSAVADPSLGTVVRGAFQAEVIETLAGRLGGADARTRAGLFASQVAGVIFGRYILFLEPIASLNADEIVDRLAPALTHILLGRAPRH